jgi:coenzyme PQQ precursor peptide PqqA
MPPQLLGEGLILQAMLPREPRRTVMKVWNKPQVHEQEVGLEVTSYLPAEIDII